MLVILKHTVQWCQRHALLCNHCHHSMPELSHICQLKDVLVKKKKIPPPSSNPGNPIPLPISMNQMALGDPVPSPHEQDPTVSALL